MTDAATAQLDPRRLITTAVKEAGYDDLGDDDFVESLAAFCTSVRDEGRLNELGLLATEAEIVRMLVNRLRFHRDLTEHPEILEQELVPPIVVTGLPRSGTTKLLRVLSEDPGVQRLDWWRLVNPGRVSAHNGQDPRLLLARQMEQELAAAPVFMAGHPTAAEAPDEDLMLYELTFDCYMPVFRYRIPSFAHRVLGRDVRPSYAYVRKLLQYLQWQDGGGGGRPWVLKTPVHMGHLPVLLETYPGATVVQCHRHPRETIPSFVRMVEVVHALRTDEVDIELVVEQTLDYWADMAARCLSDREAGCENSVIDVMFAAIRDHPAVVVEAVHRKAGREVPPDLATRIARFDEHDVGQRVGKHEYSLERYGLTAELIDGRFADYIARFFSKA